MDGRLQLRKARRPRLPGKCIQRRRVRPTARRGNHCPLPRAHRVGWGRRLATPSPQHEPDAIMHQEPLIKERIEAAAKFLAEFEKHFPLLAAFWYKRDEDSSWALAIASD